MPSVSVLETLLQITSLVIAAQGVIKTMTKSEENCLKEGYKTIKATRKCKCCDVIFNIYKKHDLKHKKYCSIKCQSEGRKKPIIKKICKHCNLEFIPCKSKGKKQQFCSVKCRAQVIKPKEKAELKMIKNCETCNNEMKIFLTIEVTRKKYCSVRCKQVGNGKILSFKMKAGLISKPPGTTPETVEKTRKTWQNKNIKRTTPLRRLIQSNINHDHWRKFVFERDNYTCQKCGTVGKIHAHHIKHFARLFKDFLKLNSNLHPENDKNELFRLALVYEPFWDTSNGITLCHECHQKEHPKLNIMKKKD